MVTRVQTRISPGILLSSWSSGSRSSGSRPSRAPSSGRLRTRCSSSRGSPSTRSACTRVGTPVYDAHLIDVGRGFEAHDNANLQENAETSHKKKADKISKEQYLLQLPPHLSDYHLGGDLHIHDLEVLRDEALLPGLGPPLLPVLRPDARRERDEGLCSGTGEVRRGCGPPCGEGPRVGPDQLRRRAGLLQLPHFPCPLLRGARIRLDQAGSSRCLSTR